MTKEEITKFLDVLVNCVENKQMSINFAVTSAFLKGHAQAAYQTAYQDNEPSAWHAFEMGQHSIIGGLGANVNEPNPFKKPTD